MQSPLTPQRGRIESNPREYTHMGLSTNLPDECGFSDTRAWKFGRKLNESGFSDENSPKTPKNRPEIHSRFLTVHHSRISHLSFITNMRDN